MILVPADYRPDKLDSTITIQDIFLAVGNARPRYFLLIVDCCHAKKIADDFVINLECEIPVYILASCSSQQKSLSFKTLKNGLFTYFLVNYMFFVLKNI